MYKAVTMYLREDELDHLIKCMQAYPYTPDLDPYAINSLSSFLVATLKKLREQNEVS